MKNQVLYKVLRAPVISEKSTALTDLSNQFVFKVKSNATKPQIKSAIELIFGVKVSSVNVLNVKGKAKRYGRFLGARSDWKKAYIKLEEGSSIELASP